MNICLEGKVALVTGAAPASASRRLGLLLKPEPPSYLRT